MKRIGFVIGVIAAGGLLASAAWAHFQMLIPSSEAVSTDDSKDISLDIVFGHPMEGENMNMAKPVRFGVMVRGKKHDLLNTLKSVKAKGCSAFKTSYKIKRPGDHVFYLEPAPYWEPAERCMIVHYTKVVVNAMGLEVGWDAEVGLPVEIVPLVRPYGLWTGNIFRGIVKQNGKPVPFAEIEVEYLNEGGKVQAPKDCFITQVIKADANGVFSYAMPKAGWWGFAALCEGDKKIKSPNGELVPVELGGLIWVKTVDMK